MSKKANKIIVIAMVVFMLLGVIGGIVAPMLGHEGHDHEPQQSQTWGS